MASAEKRYSHAEIDPGISESYLEHSDYSRCWNRMAMIYDIRVDASHRRQVITTALLKKADTWAHQRNLYDLRSETQDINVAACQLYEHCGFVLGGLDQYLYVGILGKLLGNRTVLVSFVQ
jgi:streptothricin acetyltransferase